MEAAELIILGLILLLLFIFIRGFRIVPQAQVYVIERFGSFRCEWQTGIHYLCPFIERIASKVSLKEKVVDFKPQPVITKDNVTMQIDTVVFYKITDAKQYTYGVERPLQAIENLSATTLRNIIGELELDATLTSRDVINSKITSILDMATDRWGIKVERVEGDKKSQILVAEGEKESQILRAQAKKEAQILEAEAEKQALILKADAVREQKILEATGEAQAIEMVQQAVANSIVKLNSANPNEKVIQLKSLESFAKAADGKATKIIIPSEIQGLAGLAAGLKGIVEKDNQN